MHDGRNLRATIPFLLSKQEKCAFGRQKQLEKCANYRTMTLEKCAGGYFIMVKDIVRDVIFLGRKSEAATKADLPVVKNLQEGEILC